MEITTSTHGKVCVVAASGRVDSFTAPRLSEAFQAQLDHQNFWLVFDMTDIDYVSSAGLRVMIDVQKACLKDDRGELVLVNVQRRIYETLELAGFVVLFKFFDSVEHALSYFE